MNDATSRATSGSGDRGRRLGLLADDLLERDLAVAGIHLDRVPLLEAAFEQRERERVFDEAISSTRTGAAAL